uniref:Ig-like domain-containing protein n=1 Tax=Meloidogyne enterolobii TaxID=390850 RepID=A0A6V7WJJ0_MELEN|nr:unnamed protein product [Meloidogyne enterolobii]
MPFQKPVGVKVDGNQMPPNFIRPLRDKRALIGQRIVLECQIDGHPDPVIKWLKDGHNVSQCPDYELSELGKSYRLTVHKAQAADCGRFTVQAMNAVGIKQSSCVLIVAPAPTPIPGAVTSVTFKFSSTTTNTCRPSAPLFIKELKHQPLRLGSASVFEARVVGVPLLQIEWLKNGEPLNNYRIKTEYDAHSGICLLQIPQMFAEDVGEYTCKASNAIGVALSSAKLLTQEQYDTWFSNEQAQFTRDRKERLLQAARQQIQQQAIGRRNSQQKQKSISQSPRSTPSYIQRQLDQIAQQQQSLAQINASTLSYEKGSEQHSPLPSEQLLPLTQMLHQLRQKSLAEVPPSTVPENQYGHHAQSSASVGVYPLSSNNQIITPKTDLNLSSHPDKQVERFNNSQLPQDIVSPNTHIRQQQRQLGKQISQAPTFASPNRQLSQQPLEKELRQNQNRLSDLQRQEPDYKLQEPTLREFRLRTPPREQYHISERNTGIDRQPQKPQQSPQNQQYRPPIITQPQQNYTPQSFQADHSPHLEHIHSPHKSQATSEWDINQWLFDSYSDKKGSYPTKIHPYLKPPEQVEYFLQQQNRLLERKLKKMAPPKVQKNGPMANGTAVQQNTSGGVSGNVKPPQFVEMPKPLAVKPGDKAVFTAKATGQPVPELTWTSLSQPQKKLTADSKKFQIAGGKDGQSKLTILSVQEQDLGVYACVASNPGGSFQAQFALQFADEIKKQQNQQKSTASAVTARHKLQSPSPGADQIERIVLKRTDRSRQFTNAKRPHLEEGEEQKPPSREPPKFTSPLKSQTLVEGQHALLDCKFSPTDDPNLKVAWLLNGKPVVATQRVTILNEFGYSVLEINPVTVFDHGEYTCIAVNTLGEKN